MWQIKEGIAVHRNVAQTKVDTLIKCILINWSLYNFIVLINDFNRILKVYVNAVFFGVITLFVLGWRTLLAGRFLQYTSIYFLGAKADVHSNGVGIIAAIGLIIAVYLYLKNEKLKCFIINSVLLACVFLTGSRKSIVLTGVGIFLIILYLYPRKKFRKIMFGMFGILLGFLLIMKVPYLYEIAGSRIENTIDFFLTGKTKEASMSTRNRLVETGLKYFQKRPGTGYGLDNFRMITNRSKLYAHNNFVEILFSSGILGFGIYYSKYLWLIFRQVHLKGVMTREEYVTAKMLLWLFLLFFILEYWVVTYYERDILIIHIYVISYIKILKSNDIKSKDMKK
jgi:O-antigen ligase